MEAGVEAVHVEEEEAVEGVVEGVAAVVVVVVVVAVEAGEDETKTISVMHIWDSSYLNIILFYLFSQIYTRFT